MDQPVQDGIRNCSSPMILSSLKKANGFYDGGFFPGSALYRFHKTKLLLLFGCQTRTSLSGRTLADPAPGEILMTHLVKARLGLRFIRDLEQVNKINPAMYMVDSPGPISVVIVFKFLWLSRTGLWMFL